MGLLVTSDSEYVIAALWIVCTGKKASRRIWGLQYKAHNAIIHNLSYNIDLQLDTRMMTFVHSKHN